MDSEDTLREYFRYSRGKFRLTGALCVLLPVVAWANMYFSPPTWASHVTLLVPPELAGGASPILQGPAVNVLANMAASEAVLHPVAKGRGIKSEDLRDVVTVTPSPDSLTVDVACRQKTQKDALALADELLKSLLDTSRSLDFDIGQAQATNLGSALKEREEDLAKAERAVLAFLTKSDTAPDPNDSRSGGQFRGDLVKVLSDIADTQKKLEIARQLARSSASADLSLPLAIPGSEKWRERIVQLEHELRVLRTDLGPGVPEVVQKELELEEAKKTRKAETKRYLESVNGSIAPEVAELTAQLELLRFREGYLRKLSTLGPQESLTMRRLVRELNIQSQTYQNLRVQYEQARVKTEVPTVRFAVLDQPYLEMPAINKHPVRAIGLGLVVGILLSVIVTLVGFVRSRG